MFRLGSNNIDPPSIVSLAVVGGALALSLTEVMGRNGAVGFVVGFAVSVFILTAVKVAQARSLKSRLTKSPARDISTILTEKELSAFQEAFFAVLLDLAKQARRPSRREEWK